MDILAVPANMLINCWDCNDSLDIYRHNIWEDKLKYWYSKTLI